MNEVTISVVVNRAWMKEQREKGLSPFEPIQKLVLDICQEVTFSTFGSTFEIRGVQKKDNSAVREAVKEYFKKVYNMSIEDGDYSITAKNYPKPVSSNDSTQSANGSAEAPTQAKPEERMEVLRPARKEQSQPISGSTPEQTEEAAAGEGDQSQEAATAPKQTQEGMEKYFGGSDGASLDKGDATRESEAIVVDDEESEAEDAEAGAGADANDVDAEEAAEAQDLSAKRKGGSFTGRDRVMSNATREKKRQEEKAKVFVAMPELDQFLNEYAIILKNVKKYNLENYAWSVNLLLSMDSGYGITTVTEKIAELLEENGIIFSSKGRKAVREFVIPGQNSAEVWDRLMNEVNLAYSDEKKAGTRSDSKPLIYFIDLAEAMYYIKEKKFYEYMRTLASNKGSFIYIFRIPYVEDTAFATVQEILQDQFLIRPLVIPPFSNEKLVGYLKAKLQRGGIALDGDVDDLLENLIAFEKHDGRFNGLKTMDKLAADIVYHKLANMEDEESVVISRDDLIDAYTCIKGEDIDPEEILSKLCGMENVKQKIDEIVAQIEFFKQKKNSGQKLSAPTMHMRFVGNPGTGKTTVARLVARIFKERGILNKGYFYEIKARDLCGRYIGETAPKTSGYCQDALGSVLFIDEAYTLYRGDNDRDYGQEAIDTLITEMENNRDNLVVIMAGYKKQMADLMTMNPGLESRMPYEIEFRNYNKAELIEIFYNMLSDEFAYTDAFDQSIRDFFENIPDEYLEKDEFSNGRLVRNLYERIWSKAAYRKSAANLDEIVLQADDVERAIADTEFKDITKGGRKTKVIGF